METLYHLEKFYNMMVKPVENTSEAFVWFSKINHPFFNCIMHLNTSFENLEKKVDSFIEKANSQFPISFWTHSHDALEQELKSILSKKNFHYSGSFPLMEYDVQSIPFSYRFMIKQADLSIFHNILAQTFHFTDEIKKDYRRICENTPSENYLIYLNEKPVGTGTLAINKEDKVGGIFNISSMTEYQKKGCGRAIMQLLIHRAHQHGLKKLVLLSSPIAEKLYLSLGFKRVLDIECYTQQLNKLF